MLLFVLLLLLLMLRPGLVVPDWLRVGCGSVSLPNVTRAFSKKNIKNLLSLCFHQVPLVSLSNHRSCLSSVSVRWAGAGLDSVSRGEREREKKTENTQYSLGVSKLHLPLHIDLINS